MDIIKLGCNLSVGSLLRIVNFQHQIIRLGANFTAVMTEAAQGAQELTDSDGSVLEIVEGSELVYRASSTSALSLLGARIHLEGSLSGECIRSGKALICYDTEQDKRVDKEATRRLGVNSMIVSPLIFDESCVGVLKVFSKTVNAFDAKDMAIVEIISTAISASMFMAAKAESSELFHIATHDSLTGLANRGLFHDRLKLRVRQALRMGDQFAIVMIDMDRLKPINDQYGHRVGDRAIKLLAQELSIHIRSSDTVARIGGDEFAILLSQVTDENSVVEVCDRFLSSLHSKSFPESASTWLDASVGYAIFPKNGITVEELMEHADKSMYVNKRSKMEKTNLPPSSFDPGI
ncbi:hypothetical protein VI06_21420 [Aquitalea magnusonii]|nr:hypothetical protein VI06_21420 [Aquitalea magnusonii]